MKSKTKLRLYIFFNLAVFLISLCYLNAVGYGLVKPTRNFIFIGVALATSIVFLKESIERYNQTYKTKLGEKNEGKEPKNW